MPSFDAELMARLERLFEASRDDSRAEGMSRYMRDGFSFYGIQGPAQREIAREVLSGVPAPSEAQLRTVATACWKRPEREWQYFACGYLRRNIRVASPTLLPTLERLITTKSWWDTVDSLAARSVGPLVLASPKLVREMDRWIDSENIWIARTTLLRQLFFRDATDAERLFTYCLWRAVRRFVREHPSDLSGLSKREALKWLERGSKRPRARK